MSIENKKSSHFTWRPNIYSSKNDLTQLVEKIETSGISVARSYDDYLRLAIAFFSEQGKNRRGLFHRVCSLESKYDSEDCDKQFDEVSQKIIPAELRELFCI